MRLLVHLILENILHGKLVFIQLKLEALEIELELDLEHGRRRGRVRDELEYKSLHPPSYNLPHAIRHLVVKIDHRNGITSALVLEFALAIAIEDLSIIYW